MYYYLHDKKIKLYLMLTGAFLALCVSTNASAVKSINKGDSKTIMPVSKVAAKITGTVTDDAGLPLVGVTVKVKGVSTATSTDANGKFTLTVSDENVTLIFSYISYVTQEVQLNGSTTLNVKLKQSNKDLSEVVVVGYGSQRRAEVTGAIASVSGTTLTALPTASIDEALQGRVAGLSVVNNGSPGTAPLVVIRGNSSITFGSDPLYVVDGFPISGSLTSYDARDVENVQPRWMVQTLFRRAYSLIILISLFTQVLLKPIRKPTPIGKRLILKAMLC
jgi:hypothetical protein